LTHESHPSERARAHAVIHGHVQGVFYRASTQDQARQLALVGFVRNLAEGAVELEAEGSRSSVDKLLDWCRKGPPAARVDQVEVTWIDPTRNDRDFRVFR